MAAISLHPLIEPLVSKYVVSDEGSFSSQELTGALRSVVDNRLQQLSSQSDLSTLMARLTQCGVDLLNFDARDSARHKVSGICLLDCLIDVNDENSSTRRVDVSNNVRKVFENEKLSLDSSEAVLRAAAQLIGHFARISSTVEIDFLQNTYLTLAFRLITSPRGDHLRFSGCVILTQLAINSPALLFSRRREVLSKVWEAIGDKNSLVRNAAAGTLESLLQLISQREDISELMNQVLRIIELGFQANSNEKVVGSLHILTIVFSGDSVSIQKFKDSMDRANLRAEELIWKVIQRRNIDGEIKERVVNLIPSLAGSFSRAFTNPSNSFTPNASFLQFTVKHLLDVIKAKRDRSLAFVCLGRLFQFSLPLRTSLMVEDIFNAISDGFRDSPFCIQALHCLTRVLNHSPSSRKFVDRSFVELMFRGGLTRDLVEALEVVIRHISAVRVYVQEELRLQIVSVLQKYAVVLDDPQPVTTALPGYGRGRILRMLTKEGGPMGVLVGASAPVAAKPAPKASTPRQGWFFSSTPTEASSASGSASSEDEGAGGDAQIILAMQILASTEFFHISRRDRNAGIINQQADSSLASSLVYVLKDAVIRYLDDLNVDIRGAAISTCLGVLNNVLQHLESTVTENEIIVKLIERLLLIGVGDNNAHIRSLVFLSISPMLDHVVSHSNSTYCLVEGLNDESIDVRVASMAVLSRVAHYDPLHVMPTLRLTMRRLIVLLQHSTDHQIRRESVQLLEAMVRGAHTLIVPYVNQILLPLTSLLDDSSPAVVGAALSTIGELAVASPESIREYIERLFPRLIAVLQTESSLSLQEIAVVVIGKLVSSLSLLTDEPFSKFPGLFSGLVRAIQSDEGSRNLKLQAIRTAGLLGAADPEIHQSHLRKNSGIVDAFSQHEKVDDSDDATFVGHGNTSTGATGSGDGAASEVVDRPMTKVDKYYFMVVMRELVRILLDPSLASYHQSALSTGLKAVRHVGPQAYPFMDDFINAIIVRLRSAESGPNMRDILLDSICGLVHVVGRAMRNHQALLVDVIQEHLDMHLNACLDLVEALYQTLSFPSFNSILRSIVPHILHICRDEAAETHRSLESLSSMDILQISRSPSALSRKAVLPKASRIMQTVANVRDKLGEFRRQMVHLVISVFDNENVHSDTRKFALCVSMHLADDVDLNEFANGVMHPLMRVLSNSSLPADLVLIQSTLIALSLLVCRLGVDYYPFIVSVRRCIRGHSSRDILKLPQTEEYESLVVKLLRQRLMPSGPSDIAEIAVADTMKPRLARAPSEASHQIGMQALETAWALANRDNASDLLEWMQRLSMELIRQSPSPLIRMCAPLTKVYRPMAEQLFNASFSCIWDELYAGETSDVIDDIPLINGIEMALNSSQIPGSLVNVLLNLVEFMDMQDKRLPIDVPLLGRQAESANMFSKCLHYREIEFNSPNVAPTSECVEALITMNNELGLQDRARGALHYVSDHCPHIEIKPLWLEKLSHWQDARSRYLLQNDQFRFRNPLDRPTKSAAWMASELGVLRCLYALGEYEQLRDGALALKEHLRSTDPQDLVQQNWLADVQNLGANAAWTLGQWSLMSQFVEGDVGGVNAVNDVELNNNTTFYRAVLAIHDHKYDQALRLIVDCRQQLSQAISTLMSENYNRAHRAMVSMQILAELEEVIDYKQCVSRANLDIDAHGGHEQSSVNRGQSNVGLGFENSNAVHARFDIHAARTALIRKWNGRLKCVPKEIDTYRQILAVHSLAVDPTEDLDSWLELVSLCRNENMFSLCGNILSLLGAPAPPGHEFAKPHSKRMSLPSSDVEYGGAAGPGGISHSSPQAKLNAKPNVRVMFAAYNYWWSSGERTRALSGLSTFLSTFSESSGTSSSPTHQSSSRPNGGRPSISRSNSNSAIVSTFDFDLRMFRVRCLLKRAEWMRELGDSPFTEVLATVKEATELASEEYSVWHAWAVANYNQLQKVDTRDTKKKDVELDECPTPLATTFAGGKPFTTRQAVPMLEVARYEAGGAAGGGGATNAPKVVKRRGPATGTGSAAVTPKGRRSSVSLANLMSFKQETDHVSTFVVEAIKGFVRSIVLGRGQPIANVLQDTLRLLTLWFTYGTKKQVFGILSAELDRVSPENWLMVVPQLIARMHVKSNEIAGLLQKLLIKLAGTHPQALVCPIYVALNTSNLQQKRMAADVVLEMRKNRSKLVDEATMVSRELMRVAMTPHETWHDGLELAAQQYMEQKDTNAMLKTLMELHEAMNDSPSTADSSTSAALAASEGFTEQAGKVSHTTLRDISFRQSFGRPLADAFVWLRRFQESGRTTHLHQAWEVYQQVFKKIKTQIQSLKKVELHHVSPALTQAVDISLAVPGTYSPFKDTISIRSFSPSVTVIASKQRPRKMSIIGSDGQSHPFLLKGHEDLRQDERVMQLFGLINVCFDNSRTTRSRELSIIRYSVLPLSNNSGVIGWVNNCDTLNQLIKQYRELKNMRLNIETKLMQNKCANYNKLPLINKMEVFTQVMEETTGQDLAKMLWLRSKTADAWVERRAHFTKSMAVMSMVGYILGLGDRHPSNLMLDRISGSIVHIDFGDCFEVTSKRAKFPEIIPFRLTRMLSTAMERTGIEGTYRMTAERVMRVLRDNRDSVMAMLEAFVYDPLISWRLLGPGKESQTPLSQVDGDGEQLKSPMDKIGAISEGSDEEDSDQDEDEVGKKDRHSVVSPTAAAAAAAAAGGAIVLGEGLGRRDSRDSFGEGGGSGDHDNVNSRALEVITRIQAKLTGGDFAKSEDDSDLTVEQQVNRLIQQATSVENLCQLYQGWCPMW